MKILDSQHIAFVPKGDSMWPFLKNKKQTVIIDKSYNEIKEYDVVLYSRANGDKILHRVIRVEGDRLGKPHKISYLWAQKKGIP